MFLFAYFTVSKRSADPLPDAGKYAEFMGKGVIEYDLSNIAEVEAYEAMNHWASNSNWVETKLANRSKSFIKSKTC